MTHVVSEIAINLCLFNLHSLLYGYIKFKLMHTFSKITPTETACFSIDFKKKLCLYKYIYIYITQFGHLDYIKIIVKETAQIDAL